MDFAEARELPFARWCISADGDHDKGIRLFSTPNDRVIKRGIVAVSSTTADCLLFPRVGGSLELLVFQHNGGFLAAVCHQSENLPVDLRDQKVITTFPLEDMTSEGRDAMIHWGKMVGQMCKSNGEVTAHAFL